MAARFLPTNNDVVRILFVISGGVYASALVLNPVSCCENMVLRQYIALVMPVGA